MTPCAFWLTNTHELFSLITKAEHDHERDVRSSSTKRKGHAHDFGKLLETLKYELQALEDTIFHAWMKELKRRANKMVIPAIIEGQSLPGFVSRDTGRFFSKSAAAGAQQSFTMDDLLNFLNRIWRTMKCYYMERAVANQVMTELLKLIGVTSFNDLLMRKNFSSWKRGK